jgi:hypothetical protein
MANFSFNDNLVTTGRGGFHQELPGKHQPGCGATNASGLIGVLVGCMGNTWQFAGNTLANTSSKSTFPGNPLPPGNLDVSSPDLVGFVNFNHGNGGDYHLSSASPYLRAAQAGRDPGADIDALNAAVAGIE